VTPGVPLAEVTRLGVPTAEPWVESVHTGHLVVTDGDGEVQGALGDAAAVTFVRSTAKPFQATACLEVLGAAGEAISREELAVAWSSHRGEPGHLAAVGRLLARSDTDPDGLTCPGAVPEADPAATPARILHNCSGKHALFAWAGRSLGVTPARLLDPSAPLQRAVLGVLEEVLGPFAAVGTDGCGAPAVAVPLERLGHAFARLAAEARFAAVREAGLAHPELVGGRGRLESSLLGAGVVAKVGAEGVYAAGWIGGDGVPRGLAAKAADGGARASATATVELLVALGVITAGLWAPEPVLGGGEPVGTVRATAEVLDLASALGRSG
jgi:L-asparaginase II